MDSMNDSMLRQKQEMQDLVDWIIPKLVGKESKMSRDNLWNEINSIHSDDMMDIFKAISIYASKKQAFISWFKFLLTNHYKNSMSLFRVLS